ncbi:hypothetical protein E2562_003884 [Oryza meyeriana var. granulata]|uniref:Uncharacterized protein n=1 Tax=Oryza meyeriana var. granulata TaxID=110450 RepID=A0A6G1CYN4_9ORYZ|nr:hypothetical protein E2562_003884 [Oryza meyeriana var. granulata]
MGLRRIGAVVAAWWCAAGHYAEMVAPLSRLTSALHGHDNADQAYLLRKHVQPRSNPSSFRGRVMIGSSHGRSCPTGTMVSASRTLAVVFGFCFARLRSIACF